MPSITEAKLFEAFGLDPNGSQGAQGQAVAEPAAEPDTGDADAGAQGQEVAEPARSVTEPEDGTTPAPEAGNADPEEPEETGDDGADTGKKTLSPEERRANAARRRAQEQQAAIDQAVAAALEQERRTNGANIKDILAQMNLQDSAGQPITTVEQFRKWQQETAGSRIESALKKGPLTAELLGEAISAHPAIQQAQQIIQQNQAAQQAQQQAADRARIEAEMQKITALDPKVRTVADLLNMPTAPKFRELVDKGLGFEDAFYLANRERLETQRAEAARQQAMNNTRGKEHLVATGNSRGSGSASVPPDQMKLFRAFNPNATEAEIQSFWNQYKKNP